MIHLTWRNSFFPRVASTEKQNFMNSILFNWQQPLSRVILRKTHLKNHNHSRWTLCQIWIVVSSSKKNQLKKNCQRNSINKLLLPINTGNLSISGRFYHLWCTKLALATVRDIVQLVILCHIENMESKIFLSNSCVFLARCLPMNSRKRANIGCSRFWIFLYQIVANLPQNVTEIVRSLKTLKIGSILKKGTDFRKKTMSFLYKR